MSEPTIYTTEREGRLIFAIQETSFNHDTVIGLRKIIDNTPTHNNNTLELNLERVKKIDSTAVGFIFELKNRLGTRDNSPDLILKLGKNDNLHELLKKFQVDKILTIE